MFRIALAEFAGTGILVLLGVGAVHVSVLTGALTGLGQVAMVWGIAVVMGIYVSAAVSGGHLNPAVTTAMAWLGRTPWSQVPVYVMGQLAGAFTAAAILFALFSGYLAEHESKKNVVRGETGSIVTAMCFGEYFPNPAPLATAEGPFQIEQLQEQRKHVSVFQAMLIEALGTGLLVLVIVAVTDPRNSARPGNQLAPLVIGLTLAGLIALLAPLTQAGFNPARDLGPRIFAALAGWGSVALPGQDQWSWLTVYILSPVAGGLFGAAAWRFALCPNSPTDRSSAGTGP